LQASTHGHFELNVYKPLIIFNILNSIRLLTDAMFSFNQNCLAGIEANTTRINAYLHHSLMLVTALNPIIGYDQSAKIAKHAHENHLSLKEAAMALNILDENTFDDAVDALSMARPHKNNDE
jgi:fumarate hydratase class II